MSTSGAGGASAAGANPGTAMLGQATNMLNAEVAQTHELQNATLSDSRRATQSMVDNTTTRAMEVSPQAQASASAGAGAAKHT